MCCARGRKGLAAATLLCDALKGTAAVLLAAHFATPDAALHRRLGAFLGHLFPVWLKFKGGKGVAVYIGVLIGLYWPAALIFCAIWLVVAALSRYSSLAALDCQRAHAAGAVAARPTARRRSIPPAQRACSGSCTAPISRACSTAAKARSGQSPRPPPDPGLYSVKSGCSAPRLKRCLPRMDGGAR